MRFKKIYIEITNMCNLNCSFCSKDNNIKREITVDEFKNILNRIKNYTNYIYLHVKGEPFFHNNLKGILNLCKKHNIKVNITTNGTLLSKNEDLIINNEAIRQINISLHSFEDNYNSNAIKSIMNTVDHCLEKTNIYFVYRFWSLNKEILSENNMKIINAIIDHYKIDRIKEKNILHNKNAKIKNNLYINKDEIFEWPSLKNDNASTKGFCYGLKNHIGILVDGTVIPCCLDSKGIINLGNIYNENLEDILNKKISVEILEGFRKNIVVNELCQKCRYRLRFNCKKV